MRPGSKDPEPGCTCASCEVLRRKCRERKYRLQRGLPNRVSGEDLEPLFDHIHNLAVAGLTGRVIANRSSPGCKRIFERTRRGDKPNMVHWTTYNALMSVLPYTTIADMPGPMSGPRTNGIGAKRRLQGLAERGFTVKWMAGMLGMAQCTVQLILTGQQPTISRKSHGKIRQLFKTWSVRDPFEWDIAPAAAIKYRITLSRKAAYAPSAAWDDDTMDNPRYKPKGLIKENS